jgi:pyruvate dehydrogenase E2 component (dihydrolipoamide acetyltransferase)
VDRARSGRLSGDELAGATTTLSNLGGFGVAAFQALLTPPQATALSLGAVEQRPVVRHGGIAIRTRCTAGLTVDHRIVDGADAARLLATLREVVADPSRLLG